MVCYILRGGASLFPEGQGVQMLSGKRNDGLSEMEDGLIEIMQTSSDRGVIKSICQ